MGELKEQLILLKHVILLSKEAGLTDSEIASVLGLNPVRLGKTTRQVLRAIQQGVKADSMTIAEQVFGSKDKYRLAHYHLKRLEESGYLVEL